MSKYIELEYNFIPGIGLYTGIQRHTYGLDIIIFLPFVVVEITFKKQ